MNSHFTRLHRTNLIIERIKQTGVTDRQIADKISANTGCVISAKSISNLRRKVCSDQRLNIIHEGLGLNLRDMTYSARFKKSKSLKPNVVIAKTDSGRKIEITTTVRV